MGCGDNCTTAKGDKCTCICNGINHGIKTNKYDDNLINIILTEKESKEYREQMDRRFECFCGYNKLHELPIYGYEHYAGWNIRNGLYWLWIHCPDCNYDWSIQKLGIPSDYTQKTIMEFAEGT